MNKKNLTKKDLIKELSYKTGFPLVFSKKLIEDLINILIINICKNELNLKNIGVFKVISKKERLGRNPITKEEHVIEARNSLTFKASKKLLNAINL